MKSILRIVSVLGILALMLGNLPQPLPASADPTGQEAQPDGPRIRLLNASFDPLADPPAEAKAAALTPAGVGYYMVQFEGPVGTAQREALAQAGAEVLEYVPDFAFLVRMDGSAERAVASQAGVRWIGSYSPAYRLAPELTQLAAQAESATAGDEIEVAVVVFRGEDLDAIAAAVEKLGGAILDRSQTAWNGKLKVSIAPAFLDEVAALPGVNWVERAPEWRTANEQAVDVMGVREVWNTHGLYGQGQIIAVCDTGLDQGSTSPASLHNDFENGSGTSRVIVVHDRVGDGGNDVNSGHGTHVAGSVLGNGSLSGATPASHTYPDTAHVGAAPEATLVFQAVEDNANESLSGIPWDLTELFGQAATNGAKLHTNSWGSDSAGDYTNDSQTVDQYVWDHKDFTILFAAGNAGTDTNSDGVVDPSSVGSPGTAKNSITVGASENDRPSITDTWGEWWPSDYPANPINSDSMADDIHGMAAFSSRGPTEDGRIKPDLVAPGTFIISTRSSQISGNGWGAVDTNYMHMGGTSMATPLVAGAATLVREFYTDQGITPSAALIKGTLANGAINMAPGQYGTGSTQEIPTLRPTNVAGWGRVNVENSLFPTGPRVMKFKDEATGLDTGEDHTYTYYVTDASEPLRFTLSWNDYPGSLAAGGALVNDLDLVVTAPDNTVYYANNRTTPDRINNLVGIDIPTPQLGTYVVSISGYNVPYGPQPYALIVSGVVMDEDPNAPTISAISPSSGPNTTTVHIDSLTGARFAEGATVKLSRYGYSDQPAINVTVVSSNLITCDINLNGLAGGQWNVVVTNPDEKTGILSNGFTVTFNTDVTIYLPLIAQRWPPFPMATSINAINNPYGVGHYAVSWNASDMATTYELQEDDNPSFTSPETVYAGSGMSWNASGKGVATYYYRVRGVNSWGNGPWSGAQWTSVTPGPEPGYWATADSWVTFDVSANKAQVQNFSIYIGVTGCGNYRIRRTIASDIVNNQFSFSGSFYASGTFNSATMASGTAGLDKFYISGCGSVSLPTSSWGVSLYTPLARTAPIYMMAERVAPDTGAPAQADPNYVIEVIE